MRFWTVIPLFFLLNYSFCGQEEPPQPNTLEVSAETTAGVLLESVSIRVEHKGGAESAEAPAIFEIPADTDALIAASRDFWSFSPADSVLSLGAEELHQVVFLGPAPATLTILCNEVGSGDPVSGVAFRVFDEVDSLDIVGSEADVELPIGLPFTVTCYKFGWTLDPDSTVLTLTDDSTLQIWGTPPENPPATLNVSAQDGDGAAINNATILLNGEDSGFETPAALELISGFEYTLALELAGWDFAPADTTITLDAYAEDDLVFVGEEQVTLEHMVLLEDFSNIGCAGCPAAEANMMAAMDEVGGQLVSLSFHWNSPTTADPFFFYDNFPPPWQGPNYDRPIFFGIGSLLPQVVVDGEIMPATSQSVIADAIVAAQAREPVANMILQREMQGASVLITVTGELLSDPGEGPWRLYVILYEKHIVIDPAPGSNGQTEFHHIVRHGNYGGDNEMGVDLDSVLDGTSMEYSVKFNPNFDEVDAAGLRAVAFIQHSDSKMILDTVAEETGGH